MVPEVTYGLVVSSNVPSGPASSITYVVKLWVKGSTITVSGIKPGTNRPPDEIDTLAAKPGTLVKRIQFSPGDYVYDFQEFPAWADCEG